MPRVATVSQIEQYHDDFRKLLLQVPQDLPPGSHTSLRESDTHVFARVRPVLPHEAENGSFRIVFAPQPSKMSVHMLTTTLKGLPSVQTSDFKVDLGFGATVSNSDVYDAACSSLVQMAKGGGTATLFAYGQTGSGKTYTVAGLLDLAIQDLFVDSALLKFRVSVFEILGDNVKDLLDPDTRASVQILEDRFGAVQFKGCINAVAADEEELRFIVSEGFQSRRTESTERNDSSSRSHMIVRISIENLALAEAEEGVLCLVDLAGSESATDKTHHNVERMKESKLINSSLMNLKECMRGRSMVFQSNKHVHIPYRASKLTLALRDCFELAVRRPIKTAIIACVSPLETACSHSTNTLRYAADIRIAPSQVLVQPDEKDPSNWDHDKCTRFLLKAGKGRAIPKDILPEGSGKTLVRIPEHDFIKRALSSGKMNDVQAKELYITLWKLVADARSRFKHIQKNVTAPPQTDPWIEVLLKRVREEEPPCKSNSNSNQQHS